MKAFIAEIIRWVIFMIIIAIANWWSYGKGHSRGSSEASVECRKTVGSLNHEIRETRFIAEKVLEQIYAIEAGQSRDLPRSQ